MDNVCQKLKTVNMRQNNNHNNLFSSNFTFYLSPFQFKYNFLHINGSRVLCCVLSVVSRVLLVQILADCHHSH